MKNILSRLALTSILFLLFCVTSVAQEGPLNLKSTDPQGDSVAILQIRERLAMLHKQRPTVVVVLSGGGAKGAAHVGVLKYLEEHGIPVDAVLGTSMGGLVGGLYSLGYNATELDTIIRSLDWSTIMLDRVPREFVPYEEIKRKDTYLVDIPFYYKWLDIPGILKANEKLIDITKEEEEDMELNIGAGSKDMRNALLARNIASTLPSAMVSGHNVNNSISRLIAGYQDDSLDFISLPRPFVCIATEMVSGKQKIWHQGNLLTAMRSTMSIPGLFAPVRAEGMVLTDGGMRNNYPTDLAKMMDPDYIIGVELSDRALTNLDINNIGNIIDQMITILGKSTFDDNENLADVKIKPDLGEYNMLSFSADAIDVIIQRGYEAAQKVGPSLDVISRRVAAAGVDNTLGESAAQKRQKAFNIADGSLFVSAIEYNGITGREVAYLEDKLQLKPGFRYSRSQIEKAINEIYGSNAFSSVTYRILGSEEPYKLIIDCARKPIHSVAAGFRFDTETLLSAILDINLNGKSIEGHALDFTARISGCPYAQAHYSYKGVGWPTLNVLYYAGYYDANLYEMGRNRINLRYNTSKTEFFLSDLKSRRSHIIGGFRSQTFNIQEILTKLPDEYSFVGNTGYLSMFVDSEYRTFNDTYFPSKGVSFNFGADFVFLGYNTHVDPFLVLSGKASTAMQLSDKLTFIPRAEARMMFGQDIPVPYMNMVGGHIQGRFLEQQIPFIGIDYATPLSDKVVLGTMDFRWNPAKNHYISARTGLFHDFEEFDSDFFSQGHFGIGAGLEYAYDTILGPVKFDLHWSNITKFGAYLSFGYDF